MGAQDFRKRLHATPATTGRSNSAVNPGRLTIRRLPRDRPFKGVRRTGLVPADPVFPMVNGDHLRAVPRRQHSDDRAIMAASHDILTRRQSPCEMACDSSARLCAIKPSQDNRPLQWSMIIKRRPRPIATAWFALAQRSMEMMQGSATMITTRTAAMAKAGSHPSAAHDREMRRMVEEKVDASAASLTGMAFAAAASCQSLWLGSLWRGHVPTSVQLQRATTRVLGAGIAPYQKTVRSNVKRLRK